MPLIELKDVKKSYSLGDISVDVLKGVDLSIELGDFVVMTGPSGSGKSTLLNIIAGIDSPDSGQVKVEGKDLTKMSDRELTLYRRNKIGYIFQFYNLIPTLTALENIELALELQGQKDLEPAQSALERVGLLDKASRFPAQLSGGEQQRIAIARALVKRPNIVAGDEPTGNLDVHTSAEVIELLRELNRDEKETILIATHDITLAASGERLIRLEDGRIIED